MGSKRETKAILHGYITIWDISCNVYVFVRSSDSVSCATAAAGRFLGPALLQTDDFLKLCMLMLKNSERLCT